jgi:hypothetical protein
MIRDACIELKGRFLIGSRTDVELRFNVSWTECLGYARAVFSLYAT